MEKEDIQLFPYSRPYGYYPKDVNIAIEAYNEVLKEKENEIIALQDENFILKNKIKELTLEMGLLEIPNISKIQEEYVLDKFKEENLKKHGKLIKETDKYKSIEKNNLNIDNDSSLNEDLLSINEYEISNQNIEENDKLLEDLNNSFVSISNKKDNKLDLLLKNNK